ncbi:hypothetical protein PF005_g20166 [Phytophthora fragariae]|uniref:Secreted protein n=1 Tax=Phytophthora fragariae TaxID=53985 RepID=A0A6A3WNK2_9STRA|nr:hypothetical protein PF005_g20166 [Phytophthora fragariae]
MESCICFIFSFFADFLSSVRSAGDGVGFLRGAFFFSAQYFPFHSRPGGLVHVPDGLLQPPCGFVNSVTAPESRSISIVGCCCIMSKGKFIDPIPGITVV